MTGAAQKEARDRLDRFLDGDFTVAWATDAEGKHFRCQACGRWVAKDKLFRMSVFPDTLYHPANREKLLPCGPIHSWPRVL